METEVCINGTTYVPKKCTVEEKKYVIVRTYSAGVFAGILEKLDGTVGTMSNARRIWYWEGAATLSELVDEVMLTQVIEILSVTGKARKSIEGVPIWSSQ